MIHHACAIYDLPRQGLPSYLDCYIILLLQTIYSSELAGRICDNFEMNRALFDKSMKLGTRLDFARFVKIKIFEGQCHVKNVL